MLVGRLYSRQQQLPYRLSQFLQRKTDCHTRSRIPGYGRVIEIETYNRYFNLIGNIVGNATMTGGTVIDNGSGGPLPTMFRFGYSSTAEAHIRIPFPTPRQFFMGTTISSAIRSTTGLAPIILCRYLSTIPRSLPSLEIWHGRLMISLHQLTTEESASRQGIGL